MVDRSQSFSSCLPTLASASPKHPSSPDDGHKAPLRIVSAFVPFLGLFVGIRSSFQLPF